MAASKMVTVDEVMDFTVQNIEGPNFVDVKVKGWLELAPEIRERCISKLRDLVRQKDEMANPAAVDAEALVVKLSQIASRPSPRSSPPQTPTPTPPDPDDPREIENDMAREREAYNALIDDHGRPCYPIELGFDVSTSPGPYKDIVLYWQDEPGASQYTKRLVFHFQLKRWRMFRDAQQKIRSYHVQRNRFPEYQQKALERRRRHGLDGNVELLVDRDKQSLLVDWMEYQDYEYQKYEDLEKDFNEAQVQLESRQKALAEAGISGFEGVHNPDNFGVFSTEKIEYEREERAAREKWKSARQKLRLAEQRLNAAQSADLGETVERATWIQLFSRKVKSAQTWLDQLPKTKDRKEDIVPRDKENEEEWWEREHKRREAQLQRYNSESEARQELEFAEEELNAARSGDFTGTIERAALITMIQKEVRSAQTLFEESNELKEKLELKGKVLSALRWRASATRKLERHKVLLEWIEQQRREMATACAGTESRALQNRPVAEASGPNTFSKSRGKRKVSAASPIASPVGSLKVFKAHRKGPSPCRWKMSISYDSSQGAGAAPELLYQNGLRLLSLDGGVVRGLSTLYILRGLMARVNTERQAANLSAVKPCDVFDLIGGTSTGGLIAIMLGRLEMDVDQCIEKYIKFMKSVFDENLRPFYLRWIWGPRAQFDSAELERAIKELTAYDHPEREPFDDTANRHCRVFVCTAVSKSKGVTRLRSYSLPGKANSLAGITIYEAALATLATTTVFDHVSIGTWKFVSNQLGANNPVDEVEGEASDIWCSETGDLKPLINCFVSIGTGIPGKKATEDNKIKDLGKTSKAVATEAEETADRFKARWRQHYDESRYFRFNVEQGLQDVSLAEHEDQDTISSVTEEYLEQQEQVSRVRDCVSKLKQKEYPTEGNFEEAIKIFSRKRLLLSPKAHWYVPFQRNTRFLGRNPQLNELEAKLFGGDHHQRVAIIGLGGVGKTELALEFAYRAKENHPGCSVFWVPATSVDTFEQAYLEIGLILQIPGLADKNREDVKRLVKTNLSRDDAGHWLLILDNADDVDFWFGNANSSSKPTALTQFIPRSSKGSVVITTRDRKAALKMAHNDVIEVSELDETVATELLKKSLIRSEIAQDHIFVPKLLEQLTYLPFAIVQAAAYINENDISISAYFSLFEDTGESIVALLSEDLEDEGRYGELKNPVATTWLISFEKIQRRDPLATEYLLFMSCLEAYQIPKSLLPPVESERFLEAIRTLNAYSFVKEGSADQPEDSVFHLHRLVHLTTRNWLKQNKMFEQFTLQALQRLTRVFPWYDHKNRALWTTYLPHASHLLASNDIGDDFEEKFDLFTKVGLCLIFEGEYVEAETMLRKVAEWRNEKLGDEHPDTLTSMTNLASVYWNQERWKEAEELEVQVHKTRKRALGEEHPDMSTSMTNPDENQQQQQSHDP